MRIDDYSFGRIVIDGKEYRADVIVSEEKVHANWWRKEGHKLQLDDIREALEEAKPEVVVVGRGKFGLMRVSSEVENYLRDRGIDFHEAPTGSAVKQFNELAGKKRVLGAFHLTC